MNYFEVAILNKSLSLHFKSKSYDYFKYNGKVKSTTALKIAPHEEAKFREIAEFKEPKTYMIGNYIFNPNKYILNFSDQYYRKYRTLLTNDKYIFEQDLQKLKTPFANNFEVENQYSIPYIVNLLVSEKITLLTASVLDNLVDWTSKIENNPVINDTYSMVNKSRNFFKLKDTIAKKIIIDYYK